jgi:Icc-related predicted phosphoesterase
LNDYLLISELRGLGKTELFLQMNALGDEAAEYLARRVAEALMSRRNVLVLTHVPPFRDSCWHEGRISNDDYLPHFACRVVGERLAAAMVAHRDNTMTVLCGHTHSSGAARILDNLMVLTGHSQYGEPELQRVLEVE